MKKPDPEYRSPYRLPVLEPIQFIGLIILGFIFFGTFGWYIIVLAYLLIPGLDGFFSSMR